MKLDFPDNIVTAASISRILQHFSTQAYDTGIAIISADRGDRAFTIDANGKMIVDESLNNQFNNKARKKLEGLLRSAGHQGWIKTKGGFQETGMDKPAYEVSYVVPAVSNVEAKRLAKLVGKGSMINSQKPDKRLKHKKLLEDELRQDSILWGSNVAGVFFVNEGGGFKKIGNKFEPNSMEDYFTEWRKRRFAFTMGSVQASTRLLRLEYLPSSPSDLRQWHREVATACMQSP